MEKFDPNRAMYIVASGSNEAVIDELETNAVSRRRLSEQQRDQLERAYLAERHDQLVASLSHPVRFRQEVLTSLKRKNPITGIIDAIDWQEVQIALQTAVATALITGFTLVAGNKALENSPLFKQTESTEIAGPDGRLTEHGVQRIRTNTATSASPWIRP